jgi:NADPH:quinone reductase-like Zn-dependent oxidoreductase
MNPTTKMQGIAINRFGSVDELQMMEMPIPTPKSNEVLVRIKASGVNPVDVLLREGFAASSSPQFPIIMGVDLSGTVEAVGANVTEFMPGDEVYAHLKGGNGTYAEYAALPVDWVARKPTSLDHLQAAAVPCAALTAYQALTEFLRIKPGETILITGGAGGVGSFAVQIAVNLGAHVIATASSRNHAFLRNLGVSEIIDYNVIDFVEAVRSLHPDGVDAVLTTVGSDTKHRSIQTIRDGGRMVWISSEDPSGPSSERGIQGKMFYARAEAKSLDQITALIDAGKLKPFIEDILPLEQAKEAQQRVASSRVRGKLVLKIS